MVIYETYGVPGSQQPRNFVRAHRYNALRDKRTGVVFYVDTTNETCFLTTPREAMLPVAYDGSVDTGRCLGQNREWEASIRTQCTTLWSYTSR